MSRGPFRILSSELSRGWDVRAGCWMICLPGVQRGRFRINELGDEQGLGREGGFLDDLPAWFFMERNPIREDYSTTEEF